MALVASPPPSASSPPPTDPSDALDSEIAAVRAEIHRLTAANKLLHSSLLHSTAVQSHIASQPQPTPAELTPLLTATQHAADTNIHRLAFGVTAFPFTDPDPTLPPSTKPLLGVRIDIPARDGTFSTPYYLFLRRTSDKNPRLHLHRHTLPALVPIERYARAHLAAPTEDGTDDDDDDEERPQDLHALVRCVRRDLVAWRLRCDTVALLQEQLEIPSSSHPDDDDGAMDEDGNDDDDDDAALPVGKFGVVELAATGVDACFIRIIWANGALGRIMVGDGGRIDRAAVFSHDERRLGDVERLLADGRPHVYELGERLERVYSTFDE